MGTKKIIIFNRILWRFFYTSRNTGLFASRKLCLIIVKCTLDISFDLFVSIKSVRLQSAVRPKVVFSLTNSSLKQNQTKTNENASELLFELMRNAGLAHVVKCEMNVSILLLLTHGTEFFVCIRGNTNTHTQTFCYDFEYINFSPWLIGIHMAHTTLCNRTTRCDRTTLCHHLAHIGHFFAVRHFSSFRLCFRDRVSFLSLHKHFHMSSRLSFLFLNI